ncbi:acylphosphatase [Methanoculleus sp. FWC-SCC3]|uniref:acylphosphatase n=2 Tax=Methanoculleus TaxID=45989 RepID=A0ABT8M235_9EURY|nr:acylphosphatase [Methanoculleus sp. FWC-SCC3]MDN7011946.1 acylphosphatase [Methanoculleus sp. FWC-SCC3]
MKRFVATARGRVQRVSYREHVYNETFDRNISGYVKNLGTGEVEIVAEGSEQDLRDLINAINIIRRPIAVKSFTVRWEEATGEYADFEIIRGEIQEETFERMDYAGNVLHSMDMKLDQGLQLQHTMLDRQDQTLQIGKETLQVARETKEEIVGLRSDTRKHLDDEFAEMRKELVSIKDALARAGIQV